MKFTYPNFDVTLFDNTLDGGNNARDLVSKYQSIFGNNDLFRVENSLVKHNIKRIDSVIEAMCISHNDCRDLALNGMYDYLLHLETDVFPEPDIIETLICHAKSVIGAVYYRDEGIFRKPTLQYQLWLANDRLISLNLDAKEDLKYLDGSVKKFASVGLGCVLIHKSVLQKIPFRFIRGRSYHPDSYFSEDCQLKGIPIYCDTSSLARHDNRSWGKFGVDFK